MSADNTKLLLRYGLMHTLPGSSRAGDSEDGSSKRNLSDSSSDSDEELDIDDALYVYCSST